MKNILNHKVASVCKKHAFTLAEMMVVMLVLSIVLAASIPLITKKSNLDSSSIWKYVPTDTTHVYYGLSDTNSAMIGTKTPPNSSSYPKSYGSMLYLNTTNPTSNPHIAFGVNNTPYAIHFVTNTGAIAEGNSVGTLGSAAIAIGKTVTAKSNGSVAIGDNSVASNDSYASNNVNYENVAIGKNATATGAWNTAIGAYTTATGSAYAVAVGAGSGATRATGAHTTAVGPSYIDGYTTSAAGTNSSVYGAGAQTLANYGTAIGSLATAGHVSSSGEGGYATALGYNSTASATNSVAVGYFSEATGTNSTAIGYNAKCNGENATVIGANATNSIGSANYSNMIVLGPDKYINKHTNQADNAIVYIPGKLYINIPGVGTTSYLYRDVNGWITTNYTLGSGSVALSDKRVKNIIADYKSSLAQIRQLKVYRYNFKENEMVEKYKKEMMRDRDNPSCPDKRPAQFKKCIDELGEKYRLEGRKNGKFETEHVGIIAQDLEKIFPNSVDTDRNGYKNINTNEVFYAIINAIKELDVKVSEISAKVSDLAAKISEKSAVGSNAAVNNKQIEQIVNEKYQEKIKVVKTHLYVLNADVKDLKDNVIYKADYIKQIDELKNALVSKADFDKQVDEFNKQFKVYDKKLNNKLVYLGDKYDFLKEKVLSITNEVKALRKEVAALRKENNDLRKRIERLEQSRK